MIVKIISYQPGLGKIWPCKHTRSYLKCSTSETIAQYTLNQASNIPLSLSLLDLGALGAESFGFPLTCPISYNLFQNVPGLGLDYLIPLPCLLLKNAAGMIVEMISYRPSAC